MNENNKVIDFTKVCFKKINCNSNKTSNLKHKKQDSQYRSISKNNQNFLIEFKNTQVINMTEEGENSNNRSFNKQESLLDLSNSSLLDSIDSPTAEATTKIELPDKLSLQKVEASNKSFLKPIINFKHYEKSQTFINSTNCFYDHMLDYFDNIISKSLKKSSFSIISDWFECTKGENFYDVESHQIYSNSLFCCIIKEFIMFELISINLHLLILNKVHDFSGCLILDFYTHMRNLFSLLKYNFTYICRIGLSLSVFTSIFKNTVVKGEPDIAHVNSCNKEIKNILKSIIKLVKKNVILDENESFCFKHLKYLLKCFQNEFYYDLKEYSYNVYLFSGVFLGNESQLEKSYSISKVNDSREDPALSMSYLLHNQVTVPFLSKSVISKSYFLILDLDETLVHCINVSSSIFNYNRVRKLIM